jgi:hypothetical protein
MFVLVTWRIVYSRRLEHSLHLHTFPDTQAPASLLGGAPVQGSMRVEMSRRWGSKITHPCSLRYVGQYRIAQLKRLHTSPALSLDPARHVAYNVPFARLAPSLDLPQLQLLALLHLNIRCADKNNIHHLQQAIASHVCGGSACSDFLLVFEVHEAEAVTANAQPTITDQYCFPPPPLNKKQKAKIAAEYVSDLTPENIKEAPCGVCARLTTFSLLPDHLYPSPMFDVLRNELLESRIKELNSTQESMFDNPLLCAEAFGSTTKCMAVCSNCAADLQSSRVPRLSIANGLWLGNVPRELQRLNFAEKMLIARYRHNTCLVIVNSSFQRKMRANTICFSQPVAKFYSVLPPPKEEIAEYLAVMFTGPVLPMNEEYKCTPLIVQHRAVHKTLVWLCRHHPLYTDLEISMRNLESYSDSGTPVAIMHKVTNGEVDGRNLPVFDSSHNFATEDGSCTLAVHTLTGPEANVLSTDTLLGASVKRFREGANKHFQSGRNVLAVGHNDQPELLYNNVDLYPGMFPHLFPYGLGGFSNSYMGHALAGSRAISRFEHARYLLMHHTRRFQEDEYFMFIAFNQTQMRDAITGGWLLTKRSNFRCVAELVSSVEDSVLDAILQRGKDGSRVKPESEAEKKCFDLLQLIDSVGNHVEGSISSKKNNAAPGESSSHGSGCTVILRHIFSH